jgi:phosphoesterase RecJ-like protein
VSALDDAVRRAAAVLTSAQRIVCAGHVRPDGDALGSSVALALAAREAGKHAVATFGEPFVLPPVYDYLDLSCLAAPGDDLGDIDVFVACDTAVADRLGSALPLAERAGTVLVVDHHKSNDGFGDVIVVDPTAAATAQLAYHLIRAAGWEVTVPVAAALYTGLVTDTGRFQYSSTTPEVHRIAADLLATGIEPAVIGQRLYEESPFGYLRVAGTVLSRARLDEERSFVWSVLRSTDLADAGVGYEDTDGLIDLVRLAREAQVACLIKEVAPGVSKGSLRSRGAVDVAAIAATLGGGGHHNAAGFTYAGSPEAAIDLVRSRL